MQRHQEDFEKRRNAEMLEVQRMEAAEKRRSDEMQRRMQQQSAQREQDLVGGNVSTPTLPFPPPSTQIGKSAAR